MESVACCLICVKYIDKLRKSYYLQQYIGNFVCFLKT